MSTATRTKILYLALAPNGDYLSVTARVEPHYQWAAVGKKPGGGWQALGWSRSRRGARRILTNRRASGELDPLDPGFVAWAIERRRFYVTPV